MASKIIASLFFVIPVCYVLSVLLMSFSYKGPLVALYVVSALIAAALCLWPVINIFRGKLNPWSVATWIFIGIDLLLVLLTFVPSPFRK